MLSSTTTKNNKSIWCCFFLFLPLRSDVKIFDLSFRPTDLVSPDPKKKMVTSLCFIGQRCRYQISQCRHLVVIWFAPFNHLLIHKSYHEIESWFVMTMLKAMKWFKLLWVTMWKKLQKHAIHVNDVKWIESYGQYLLWCMALVGHKDKFKLFEALIKGRMCIIELCAFADS